MIFFRNSGGPSAKPADLPQRPPHQQAVDEHSQFIGAKSVDEDPNLSWLLHAQAKENDYNPLIDDYSTNAFRRDQEDFIEWTQTANQGKNSGKAGLEAAQAAEVGTWILDILLVK